MSEPFLRLNWGFYAGVSSTLVTCSLKEWLGGVALTFKSGFFAVSTSPKLATRVPAEAKIERIGHLPGFKQRSADRELEETLDFGLLIRIAVSLGN